MAVIAAATHVGMDIHNEFIAAKYDLVFYAGKPVLNRQHAYFDINGDEWDFSLAIGYTFKIWEEREGGVQVVDWSDTDGNLALSGSHPNRIILNATAADTSIDRGKYYYEAAYLVSGGYEVLLNYGEAKFI